MVAKTEHLSASDLTGRLARSDSLSPEEAERLQRLSPTVQYIYHESFGSPSDAPWLADEAPPGALPAWTYTPDSEEGGATPGKAFRLSAEEEVRSFLRFNYGKYRLAGLLALPPSRRMAEHAREVLMWHQRAMEARAVLVRANLALVLSMTRRYGPKDVEFADLVADGNLVLLRCVENFDVSRGFKFSTYVCRGLLKSFHRMAAKARRYRQHFPVEYDPDVEQGDGGGRREDDRHSDAITAVREVLADNRAGLKEMERTVVLERFGITTAGRRRTLADVGRTVGLSIERVRQIQHQALAKLRAALERDRIPA
ncbi:MAG TPA: sigma-70 family RNA polymerase sigma factor [Phycisphaerae bacterium]|nr:sigma-70 family RNA polymerase sigma factor [Phycisphaerae bacterium]